MQELPAISDPPYTVSDVGHGLTIHGPGVPDRVYDAQCREKLQDVADAMNFAWGMAGGYAKMEAAVEATEDR